MPVSDVNISFLYFVTNEQQIFDILFQTDISVSHKGKHRMMEELKKKYKNLTQEVVSLFLKLCILCKKKLEFQKRG